MSYHFLCKRGIRPARTEQFLVLFAKRLTTYKYKNRRCSCHLYKGAAPLQRFVAVGKPSWFLAAGSRRGLHDGNALTVLHWGNRNCGGRPLCLLFLQSTFMPPQHFDGNRAVFLPPRSGGDLPMKLYCSNLVVHCRDLTNRCSEAAPLTLCTYHDMRSHTTAAVCWPLFLISDPTCRTCKWGSLNVRLGRECGYHCTGGNKKRPVCVAVMCGFGLPSHPSWSYCFPPRPPPLPQSPGRVPTGQEKLKKTDFS